MTALSRMGITVLLLVFLTPILVGQETTRQKVEYKPGFKDPALKEIEEKNKRAEKTERDRTQEILSAQAKRDSEKKKDSKRILVDFKDVMKPDSPDVFQKVFHFDPVRQYLTGSCWCFSTTSFIETEIHRLTGRKIKLSEMYTVYYEFLAKARRYVAERGDSYFAEGSEGNAVFLVWQKFGAVPAEAYKGELSKDGRYDHSRMTAEMKSYLDHVKKNNLWDESTVLESLRLIMDRYMGRPPEEFLYEGVKTTPREFLLDVVKIRPEDYVCLMSFMSKPFYEYGEYEVKGNWWHCKDYYNVPLKDFYRIILHAIQNEYSVRLNGDVSEPGYNGFEDAGIIPSYDIPLEYIDQSAREFRFYNKTTDDDHDIHLVGYTKLGDHDWFLIKDSASSAQHGKFKGYWFYREDYIKLKMLTFIVHKDAVKGVLSNFD